MLTCFLTSPIISSQINVIYKDGTIRPHKNSKYCAATKSLKSGSVLKWIDCEKLHNSTKFFGNFSVQLTFEAYESGYPYGNQNLIRSSHQNDKCWSTKSPYATDSKVFKKKNSFVYLSECKWPYFNFNETQLFSFAKENRILLAHPTSPTVYFSGKYQAYVGVPFLGANQKLRSRYMYNIEIEDQHDVQTFLNITTLLEFWGKSVVSKNLENVVSLYDDDATLWPTLSNNLRTNKNEIKDYFSGSFAKTNLTGPIEWNKKSETTISDNSVMQSGIYVFQVGSGKISARYSFLLRKIEDNWKIVHHHSSKLPEV